MRLGEMLAYGFQRDRRWAQRILIGSHFDCASAELTLNLFNGFSRHVGMNASDIWLKKVENGHRLLWQAFEPSNLARRQMAVGSGFQLGILQETNLDASQFDHGMTDMIKHSPNLVVLSLR